MRQSQDKLQKGRAREGIQKQGTGMGKDGKARERRIDQTKRRERKTEAEDSRVVAKQRTERAMEGRAGQERQGSAGKEKGEET